MTKCQLDQIEDGQPVATFDFNMFNKSWQIARPVGAYYRRKGAVSGRDTCMSLKISTRLNSKLPTCGNYRKPYHVANPLQYNKMCRYRGEYALKLFTSIQF